MTHSCSRARLEYIFTCLLPPLSPDTKVLDVGSRLGAVLFGAFHLTPALDIVGVEMNEDHCGIARDAVAKFKMDKRVRYVRKHYYVLTTVNDSASAVIFHVFFS